MGSSFTDKNDILWLYYKGVMWQMCDKKAALERQLSNKLNRGGLGGGQGKGHGGA